MYSYVPVNQPWARAGSCQVLLAPWIDLTHSGDSHTT